MLMINPAASATTAMTDIMFMRKLFSMMHAIAAFSVGNLFAIHDSSLMLKI
jgi:hypothetical protein